jgi:hypothetical protein
MVEGRIMPELVQLQKQAQTSQMVVAKKPEQTSMDHTASLPHAGWAPGNQALQKMLHSHVIQAKLEISQPNDKYEREADRVAEQVMRMSDPLKAGSTYSSHSQGASIHRTCQECDEEELRRQPLDNDEEEILQTKEAPGQTPEITPDLAGLISGLQGRGNPLPKFVRAFFESRFGRDFSQVRIHTDESSAKMARAIDSKAFTVGHDVVFAAGHYTPGTLSGRMLLAHELTHVVQQRKTNPISDQFYSCHRHNRRIIGRASTFSTLAVGTETVQLGRLEPIMGPGEESRHRIREEVGQLSERYIRISQMQLTNWEQQHANEYTAIFDPDDDSLFGYYKSSNGYEQIRDREGTLVWSNEIGLTQPILDPIDIVLVPILIGPGIIRSVCRAGVNIVTRIITRASLREAFNLGFLRLAISQLRATARAVVIWLARRGVVRGTTRRVLAEIEVNGMRLTEAEIRAEAEIFEMVQREVAEAGGSSANLTGFYIPAQMTDNISVPALEIFAGNPLRLAGGATFDTIHGFVIIGREAVAGRIVRGQTQSLRVIIRHEIGEALEMGANSQWGRFGPISSSHWRSSARGALLPGTTRSEKITLLRDALNMPASVGGPMPESIGRQLARQLGIERAVFQP